MLAHFLKAFGQAGDQLLLDTEGDGQVGILVGGIDGAPHIKIYIRGFFKKQPAYTGGAVFFERPVFMMLIFSQIIF